MEDTIKMYFSCKLFLDNFSVDLNSAGSDVLIDVSPGVVQNMATGEEGSPREVIRGRNFIHIKRDAIVHGYYGHYDKEHNAFIGINAIFDREHGWKELSRHLFFLSEGGFYVINKPEYNSFFYGDSIGSTQVDVCGQTPASVDEDGFFLEWRPYDIEDSGFVQACRAFFADGKEIGILSDSWACKPIRKMACLAGAMNRASEKLDASLLSDAPDVPEKAEELMERYVRLSFMDSCRHDEVSFPAMLPSIGIIQCAGDDILCRSFKSVITYRYPVWESGIKLVEEARVYIEKGKKVSDFEFPDIVYSDSMDGTFLSHTAYIIEGFTSLFEERTHGFAEAALEDDSNSRYGDLISDILSAYENEYDISYRDILPFAKWVAENPVCEMLYKYTGNNCEAVRFAITRMFEDNLNRQYIENVFGQLNKGSSITEILGIPKGLLEGISYSEWLGGIGCLKSLFCSDEAREYFLRMNKDDICELYNFLDNAYYEQYFSEVISILEKLFFLHGYRNWKGYVLQVKKLLNAEGNFYEHLDCYNEYLTMLLGIGEAGKNAEWKFSADGTKKAVESLREAYNLTNSEAREAAVNQAISQQAQKLEEMAFNGEEYIVTYPRNFNDIVKEGVFLRHCAKEFIGKVAYGSTALLFIRKKDEPEKPFFTMEVRGRKIRQCHGMGNRSIYTEPGMEEFLKRYCKEKDISFFEEDLLLGV